MVKAKSTRKPRELRSKQAKATSATSIAKRTAPPTLKPSDIQAGDVLLCVVDDPDPITLRIRRKIGPYTHAAIALGRGRVADAGGDGVTKTSLRDLIQWSSRIAVLKGWMWYSEALDELKRFVDWAVDQEVNFNIAGMRRAIEARKELIGYVMDMIQADDVRDPATRKADYFCSEFVIACFFDASLIRGKAKWVFKPDTFTPPMLADDRVFGIMSGYLVKRGRSVPVDDPLLHLLT